MANVVLSTASTTPVTLAASDNYYIAPTGSLTLTTGSAVAIDTTSDLQTSVDVIVDGSIISLNGFSAIDLSRAAAADFAAHSVTIGAMGRIVGQGADLITMIGMNNTLSNGGTLTSGSDCVEMDGDSASVFNDGNIFADVTAVFVKSDFGKFINTGHTRG